MTSVATSLSPEPPLRWLPEAESHCRMEAYKFLLCNGDAQRTQDQYSTRGAHTLPSLLKLAIHWQRGLTPAHLINCCPASTLSTAEEKTGSCVVSLRRVIGREKMKSILTRQDKHCLISYLCAAGSELLALIAAFVCFLCTIVPASHSRQDSHFANPHLISFFHSNPKCH